MSNVIPRRPEMTFEQRERAIGMLTAGMSARDIAGHFQRHESSISRLLNRFQQTGNVADRLRSVRNPVSAIHFSTYEELEKEKLGTLTSTFLAKSYLEKSNS